jgi:hypothetical protein
MASNSGHKIMLNILKNYNRQKIAEDASKFTQLREVKTTLIGYFLD